MTNNEQEENPNRKSWENRNPTNTHKHQTRQHKILSTTNQWIRPQSEIKYIANLADIPWHQNNIDIKIDTGTKARAARQHIINTQGDRYNSKILSFYCDRSLLNGTCGIRVIGIQSASSTTHESYHLGEEIKVFDT